MRNRLYVNSTVVDYVKQGSFRYVEQVCQDGLGLRFGSAFSSYVEGEVYYKPDGTQEINEGDVITYCQEMDVDQDFVPLGGSTSLQTIGLFTVKKVVKGKRSYSFVAYDNLEKLNTDFSNILYNNRNNFPYTFNDFIDLVADYALNTLGVTIEKTDLAAYNLPDPTNQLIQYFYASGLTVKDILMYFADVTFQFIKCDSSGKVRFKRFSTTPDGIPPYWRNSDRYIIAPTDQNTYTGNAIINGSSQTVTLVPVFYKQDGLNREAFSFATTEALFMRKINGDVTHVVVVDQGLNRYTIQQNIIADKMLVTSYSFNYLSTHGWNDLRSLTTNYSVSPIEVHLFPFRNPFFAGQILPHIEDADGNRFSSVIMKMEQTDYEVILTCSGTENYYDDSSKNYDVADETSSLSVAVNSLEKSLASKVSKTGDTITGNLDISGGLTLGTPLAVSSGGTGVSLVKIITTVSSVFASIGTGITVSALTFNYWGKMATMRLLFTCSSAITPSAWTTIATMVSDKKPIEESSGGLIAPCVAANVSLQANGTLRIRGSISANSNIIITVTYIMTN